MCTRGSQVVVCTRGSQVVLCTRGSQVVLSQESTLPAVHVSSHSLSCGVCSCVLSLPTDHIGREEDVVFCAEVLRMALRSIGHITGKFGVEDILDVIFRDFCIGK